ncbi:glycosyl transferase family protein, partial [mine drainage metagenome]
YHWRSLPSSTSTGSEVKTYALEAGRNAVKTYLDNIVPGCDVVASAGAKAINRVVFPVPNSTPLASVLITTAGGYSVIRACLDSLFGKTTYSNYEVVLRVDSNVALSPRTTMYLDSLTTRHRFSYHLSMRRADAGFNYSVAVNALAKISKGDILVFLNDDTEIIEGEWLSEM